MSKQSDLELELLFQIRAVGLPEPEPEPARRRLIPGRRSEVDFYWPEHKVIVEVEGGLWQEGGAGHSHPLGIIRDIEKYNALTLLGYKVYRVWTDMVHDGRALTLVEAALSRDTAGITKYALSNKRRRT